MTNLTNSFYRFSVNCLFLLINPISGKDCMISTRFLTIIWRVFCVFLLLILSIALILLTPQPVNAEILNFTYAELEGADFSHRDLTGSVFAASNMRNVSFRDSNLTNSIMTEGVLLNADLRGVNFTGALIDRVTFDLSDLRDAIFVDAIATRTRFYDTNIEGADFSDAVIDRYQINLMCKRATGINSVTGVATRDSLGCRE
ncbi:pentapeptide repeat-containing protein [Geminocystis sp. NIES-3709]|uniref:pentapeptide repeat-containing protein n=1 Tax=Geminocystis sp. NIES-3709 TaxID=1617448 RepID=UPI0005FCA629|nr:pentapeptide repeat-containing protein [Geminocystis sp. NIES-3709]BAQ64084.1 putative lumenal protein [Geminocystis sp. NIES-3709]